MYRPFCRCTQRESDISIVREAAARWNPPKLDDRVPLSTMPGEALSAAGVELL
jgi:hypothetical protein